MHSGLESSFQFVTSRKSDVVEHLATFVAAVEELDAKKVIELGVRGGISTIAWLYALEGRGNLWAVDTSFPCITDPNDPTDVNLLDPQRPNGIGVQPHWIFMLGSDTSPQVLDALPSDDVDIVFIDTNHVYEDTLVELELYYPRVRRGGRIFLHDTDLFNTPNAVTEQPEYPVLTAMKEFSDAHKLSWNNNPACYGLGTIYC